MYTSSNLAAVLRTVDDLVQARKIYPAKIYSTARCSIDVRTYLKGTLDTVHDYELLGFILCSRRIGDHAACLTLG